jgi:hypothetical protein
MVLSDTGNTIRGDLMAAAEQAIQSNQKVICSFESRHKSEDDGSNNFMTYINTQFLSIPSSRHPGNSKAL